MKLTIEIGSWMGHPKTAEEVATLIQDTLVHDECGSCSNPVMGVKFDDVTVTVIEP